MCLRTTAHALVLIATVTAAGSAVAQDHVNVTITAPAIGTFPQLTAGSFDVTNEEMLSTQAMGVVNGRDVTKAFASNQPAVVQMVLPWGGEIIQILKAMASTSAQSPVDKVTCDFVHSGSNQPYYSVIIDHPIISHVELAYDSATAVATETITLRSVLLEYYDGSGTKSGTATAVAGTPRARMATGAAALPRLRLLGTAATLRRLVTSTGAVAGPPVAAFADFAATGNSTAHFSAEGSFPPWAAGAMANIEALSMTFDRPVVINTLTSSTVQIHAGWAAPARVTFTKGVGALSSALQGAMSSAQRIKTGFELADAPGRLAYSFTLPQAVITTDHTSLSNGHATEQVTMTSGTGGVTVTDLRHNVTAQVY